MIKKLYRNLWAKAEKERWLLDQDKVSLFLFYLLLFFLPTQLGKHFWTSTSIIQGLRIDYLSPTLYLTDILIIALFIFSAKKTIQLLYKYKKNVTILFIFLLSLCLGILNSKNQLAGIYGLIKILEFIFLGTYIYFNKKSLRINIIVVTFSFGIIFESILAIFQYLNHGSIQGIFYFFGERSFNIHTPGVANVSIDGQLILRPYGTFSHPNTLGGYLTIALMLCTFFAKKLNQLFIPTFILGAVGIYVSFSRTAFVAFTLFIIVFFLISVYEKYKKGKTNKLFVKQRFLSLFLIFILLIPLSVNLFSQRVFNISFKEEAAVMRIQLVEQSINMISKNPVLGVGINNYFNNLEPKYNSPSTIQPVHNIFLLTFSETGIVGILFLIIILFKSIKSLQGASFILTVLILGSLDHYLFTQQQGQILFTVVISLLLSNKLSAKI